MSLFNELKEISDNLESEQSGINLLQKTVKKTINGIEKNMNTRTLEVFEQKSKKNFFRAYIIIQKIRQYITGETLGYHLYVRNPKDNQIYLINIENSDSLEKYIIFNKTDISISETALLKQIDKINEVDYLELFNYHFQSILNSMVERKASSYTVWQVHRNIAQKYSLWKNGTKNNPGVFNQGHIIEALDAIDQKEQNWKDLFYKNLVLESISGFKGGDNGMIQVKFGSARLMEYITIFNAIKRVLKIKELMEAEHIQKAEIRKRIKSLFFQSNASEEIDNIINDFIDKTANKTIQPLEKKFASK